jgi:hypothetical protein
MELGYSGASKQRFSAQGPGCHHAHATLPLPPDNLSLPRRPTALIVSLLRGEAALDYIDKPEPEAVTR